MPFFVTRSTARHRNIIAAYSEPQFKHQEHLPDTDPDLLVYTHRDALSKKLAMLGISTDDVTSIARRDQVAVYVDRDADGAIVAAFDQPQRLGHESTLAADAALHHFYAEQKAKETADAAD